MSEPLFLSDDPATVARLGALADGVVDAVGRWATGPGPRSAVSQDALKDLVAGLDPCPDDGVGFDQALAEVAQNVLAHGVRTFDRQCVAHLHSPTLLTAAATELAIGATNQSMDSYDQAPAATLVEDHLVGWLAGTLGLPHGATGVLTAGGTSSNLLGLLLARDHALLSPPGAATGSVAADGLPAEAVHWRIVTSEGAHFSVQRAAAVLGLGHRAVVTVPTDDHGRIDLAALDTTLTRLDDQNLRVIAVVGTAGTTDLGAIDPLAELAERAQGVGAWFHVDAAVGAAFCLSDRLRSRSAGLEQADSVTADLHKLWWQPIGASALLVADPSTLAVLRHPSDYLDRREDDNEGVLNLVSRSLDTSRRFDALKVLVSLRSTGRRRLGEMVEHLVATAARVATLIDDHPDIELMAPPSTITVLFRWRPTTTGRNGTGTGGVLDGEAAALGLDGDASDRSDAPASDIPDSSSLDSDGDMLDWANTAIQRRLFESGRAVIGRTRHRGRVALKLTLVNPAVSVAGLIRLVDLVAAEGEAVRTICEPQRPPDNPERSQNPRTPLDSLDAATAAASETLLNCYLRESSGWRFDGDNLVIPLTSRGDDGTAPTEPAPEHGSGLGSSGAGSSRTQVAVGARYRSATFRHRFSWPARLVVDGHESPLGFPALAGLLLDELSCTPESRAPWRPTALLGRMLESLHNVAEFLDLRRDEIDRLWSVEQLDFISSEQALLLGHPLHPTPKSRGEMSPSERARYSPETPGHFPLRWLAATPDVVRHASATGTPAPEMIARLLRDDPATDTAALDTALAGLGPRVLLPSHPWELDHLRRQPDLADLFDSGALVDLGPLGSPVTPTTSVRTVYQPNWPWQLKFSLHVRVTNSMRVTLPKELDRAVEAARLAQTPVGRAARQVAPAFRCVHDPAYVTVARDGQVLDGFSVLLRENRWPSTAPASANVSAVTTLCQDHPFGGVSRLGRIVLRQAERQGQTPHDAGRAWFARFCDVAVVSLVRLYADLGLCFEPHQQNTLLELDDGGMPERCVYRDSQGYFHREAAHADMCLVIPTLGEATESIFPEELADERLVYYPFLNLTLGIVNTLGATGCADEDVLLADLRRCLEAERARDTRYPTTLLDRLLDDERWPCKGNLRTRFHDMDELVGEIETQSVYVTVPNPLRQTGETL